MLRSLDKADRGLVLRSLLPSGASLVYSLLVGLVLVSAQLLSFSSTHPLTPLQKTLLQAYNAYLLDPLDTVLRNDPLNRVLLVVLWGLFAWLVFEVLSRLLTAIAHWRSARREMHVATDGTGMVATSQNPRSTLLGICVRACIVLLAFILTISIHPLAHFVSTTEQQALHADMVPMMLKLGGCTLIWMAIMHCYVVLVRWYTRRTRVFGELLY